MLSKIIDLANATIAKHMIAITKCVEQGCISKLMAGEDVVDSSAIVALGSVADTLRAYFIVEFSLTWVPRKLMHTCGTPARVMMPTLARLILSAVRRSSGAG